MTSVSPQSSLYIALYSIGVGRYHWALVVTPHNTPLTIVPTFQITNQDPTQPRSVGEWRTWHKESSNLLDSSSFVGCVRLPDCKLSPREIMSWITEQEPQQGDTQLPAGQVWSCSQWVIRVLQNLINTGLYEVNLKHFHAKVLIHAYNLNELHSQNRNVVHVVSYA